MQTPYESTPVCSSPFPWVKRLWGIRPLLEGPKATPGFIHPMTLSFSESSKKAHPAAARGRAHRSRWWAQRPQGGKVVEELLEHPLLQAWASAKTPRKASKAPSGFLSPVLVFSVFEVSTPLPRIFWVVGESKCSRCPPLLGFLVVGEGIKNLGKFHLWVLKKPNIWDRVWTKTPRRKGFGLEPRASAFWYLRNPPLRFLVGESQISRFPPLGFWLDALTTPLLPGLPLRSKKVEQKKNALVLPSFQNLRQGMNLQVKDFKDRKLANVESECGFASK